MFPLSWAEIGLILLFSRLTNQPGATTYTCEEETKGTKTGALIAVPPGYVWRDRGRKDSAVASVSRTEAN
jgi:hypothetical protein